MNKKIIIPMIVVALVAGGLGFFGGSQYSRRGSQISAMGRGGQFAQFTGGGPAGAGRNRATNAAGGFMSGEVLSQDAQSITLKLQDGGSKIVFVSTSTPIMKLVTGSSKDITVGTRMTVNGIVNSDGSFTAQMIQLRSGLDSVSSTVR